MIGYVISMCRVHKNFTFRKRAHSAWKRDENVYNTQNPSKREREREKLANYE